MGEHAGREAWENLDEIEESRGGGLTDAQLRHEHAITLVEERRRLRRMREELAVARTEHARAELTCGWCGREGMKKAPDTMLCVGACRMMGELSAQLVELGVSPRKSDRIASKLYWNNLSYFEEES